MKSGTFLVGTHSEVEMRKYHSSKSRPIYLWVCFFCVDMYAQELYKYPVFILF